MQEHDSDAQLLEAAVREAGALAQTLFRQQVRKWNKPDGSPVSEADVAVDRLLKARLQGLRPTYGWLSEETPDHESRLDCERIWIADPIDGTRSFISGGDRWCIGAALIAQGRPVLAAVYRPVTEHYYMAQSGSGAFLNGVRIHVGTRDSLGGARLAGSRKALSRFASRDIVADTNLDVPLLLRLCRVAGGETDGAYAPGNKNDWDLAAGDLLVHEAGGCVTALDGSDYIYNRRQTYQAGLVAGNHAVHRDMMATQP
jgi:myo-inositol-1(or 4)-monophosphatase